MAFVDSRCFIAVRPSLEYRLPEACKAVIEALTRSTSGDGAAEHASRCIASCNPDVASGPVDGTELPEELDARSRTLCAHVQEYLQGIERTWMDFLQRLDTGLRSELKLVETRIARLKHLYHTERALSEGEYYRQLSHVRAVTRDVCARYKALQHPHTVRPEALTCAAVELRTHFASMYGTVPTQTLLKYKTHIEDQLDAAQIPVGHSFHKRVQALLSLPTDTHQSTADAPRP